MEDPVVVNKMPESHPRRDAIEATLRQALQKVSGWRKVTVHPGAWPPGPWAPTTSLDRLVLIVVGERDSEPRTLLLDLPRLGHIEAELRAYA